MPPTIQLYVYMHECGHQMVGRSEMSADCYAVRQGKREGWLEQQGLEAICAFFKNNVSGGDSAHPPGPERCAAMQACFDKAAGGRGRR